MTDKRRQDEFGHGLENLPKQRFLPCFECGKYTVGRHHVVPVAMGGTKQLPLCRHCHSLAHLTEGTGTAYLGDLIKIGMKKARSKGIHIGPPKKVTPEVVDKIHILRKQGYSYARIAVSLKISVGTVFRYLK